MNANRLWVIGAALAVVVILLLGWVVGVSPQLAEAQLAASDKAEIDAQNAVHEARLDVLRQQFANLEPMKEELAALQAMIPQDPIVEDFIDFIKATADSADVTVSSITVVEPTDADVEAPAAGAAGDATDEAAGVGLFAMSVAIDVEGPPETVVKFVRGLQVAERIYLVSNFAYATGSTGVRGGSVTGYLFVLRGAELAEAPVE